MSFSHEIQDNHSTWTIQVAAPYHLVESQKQLLSLTYPSQLYFSNVSLCLFYLNGMHV